MSPSAVTVVPPAGVTVALAPSTGPASPRVAIVPLDDHRFLTIELLSAEGFDDHLPATGVAVHLIDGADPSRTQTPLVGVAPFDDLLTVGETFSGLGWQVTIGTGWKATIEPVDGVPAMTGS